jgi:hypothetical protein
MKKIIGISWTLLGFKRGMNDYDYDFEKKNSNKSDTEKNTYMYSSRIGNGLYGSLLYVNPFLFVMIIAKELYRLEVNLRNIEHEKKSDYYKRLL